MFRRSFYFLSLILFSSLYSFSQTGCYGTVSTTLVFANNPLGTIDPPSSTQGSRLTYSGSLGFVASGQCPRVRSFDPTSSGNCWIRTGSPGNYIFSSGLIYGYVQENCPLDDFVWILFLIGFLAVIHIRRVKTVSYS